MKWLSSLWSISGLQRFNSKKSQRAGRSGSWSFHKRHNFTHIILTRLSHKNVKCIFEVIGIQAKGKQCFLPLQTIFSGNAAHSVTTETWQAAVWKACSPRTWITTVRLRSTMTLHKSTEMTSTNYRHIPVLWDSVTSWNSAFFFLPFVSDTIGLGRLSPGCFGGCNSLWLANSRQGTDTMIHLCAALLGCEINKAKNAKLLQWLCSEKTTNTPEEKIPCWRVYSTVNVGDFSAKLKQSCL